MSTKRVVAQIIIEAKTALKVGSNTMSFLLDSPVQRDWNNLPMILGTSIAGVLRSRYEHDEADELFGHRGKSDKSFDKESGSKVIISNALLLDENGRVCEGLLLEKSEFLSLFDNLPIRQHTAIDDRGVAMHGAKFDEEVLYKGSRFKFSIEFIDTDIEKAKQLLSIVSDKTFRLGGGSTKGFGKIGVKSIEYATIELSNYSSSLNKKLKDAKSLTKQDSSQEKNYYTYTLKIKPDDFFMFGSGFGDTDADMTPVYESVIDYDKQKLSSKQVLIPASSIKGALSHRASYYFNKNSQNYADDLTKDEIANMKQIVSIFGEAKNSKTGKDGSKGKIIISDCYTSNDETKVFDHVSIDRFTGGAIDGALFQEKTVASDGEEYEIEILLDTSDNSIESREIEAFEEALRDITTGMLPLGGATTKGHGVFRGTLYKDGEKI